MAVLHSAPKFTLIDGLKDALSGALGDMLVEAKEEHGELLLTVQRDSLEDALRLLRDEHSYQQLMEIAGADYPTGAVRSRLHAAQPHQEQPHHGQGDR